MPKNKKKNSSRKTQSRVQKQTQSTRPHTAKPGTDDASNSGLRIDRIALTIFVTMAVFALGALGYIFFPVPPETDELVPQVSASDSVQPETGKLTLHWQAKDLERMSLQTKPLKGDSSNICPQDYAGPEACRECHQKNYDDWSLHSHRRMNALATPDNVVGDFSGEQTMKYKGGRATFFKEDDEYRMKYVSDELTRSYRIKETIGSRFFQYYIGVGLEGPEPEDHDYYSVNHVLPFGYWIQREAWVPIVHIHDELKDDERHEPLFAVQNHVSQIHGGQGSMPGAPSNARGATMDSDNGLITYAATCNYCHTTFPLGDMFLRHSNLQGQHLPVPLTFSTSEYLAQSRPDLWDGSKPGSAITETEVVEIYKELLNSEASEHGVTLGISCEACHLGCKAHSENESNYPSFMAIGSQLRTTSESDVVVDRSAANVNWVCSRCHNGDRPRYAGGISTWNSTEFSDMSRGACSSQITCIECHDPHKATGLKWTKTPDQDDTSCIKCHEQYKEPTLRQQHTHHPAGTPGDRCMNCHMPKINEGMQDVVRTHTIFSPTQPDMIQENNPNACNLCHLEKPIDWTLKYLRDWYGKSYSESKIAENYSDRVQEQVGLGWLKHPTPAVRLVAADALLHSDAPWALPELINMLDDDYLLNRQFTQHGFEHKLQSKLDEEFGYWFYMTSEERKAAIERMRAALSK